MTAGAAQANPYIAGRALGQQRGFFGRDDILRLVQARLTAPDQGAIVLFGQRRIGKTSILLQLQRRLPAPPFVAVYFDLMDRARQPLGQVLYDIAATLAAEAGMPPPDQAAFDQRGAFFRQGFLPALYAAIGPERIPVLLFDEFDVLDIAGSDQIAESAAANTFFPYLRELLENEPRLKFIFVVGRRAEDLSINVKSIFKATIYQRVSVLDDASARELVRTAQRQGSLGFSRVALDRILELTAGHPYLTQLICQILWDSAHAAPAASPPSIQQAEQVEAAASKALEAGENIFEWIWDGLPPAERVIFAAIAAASDERAVVTEDQLTQLLQSQGVRILTRELELAPRTLVEWEMLRQVDGGYRFFIELMRRWVSTRKPLPKVKEELDRIIPLADTLYRSAEAFYRQRDLENGKGLLLQALRVNPNHLKARLLLGQLLLEQENLDEAVKELEEAYRNDEDAARFQLASALLAHAQERERAGQADAALAIYERALAISPREKVAAERRAAIWRARGDELLKGDSLDEALAAYEAAGASDKITSIHALRQRRVVEQLVADAEKREAGAEWEPALQIYTLLQQREPHEPRWPEAIARVGDVQRMAELDRLGEQALAHEQRGEWQPALALYTRLVDEAGGQQRWREATERVRGEQELAQRYDEGLAALGRGDRDQALRAFAAVLQRRPDYRDAADRIALVLDGRPRPGAITGRLAGSWLRVLIPALLAMLFATALGFQLNAIQFLGVYLVVMLVIGAIMALQEWLISGLRGRVVFLSAPRSGQLLRTRGQWLALVAALSGLAAVAIAGALDQQIASALCNCGTVRIETAKFGMLGVFVGAVAAAAQWAALRRLPSAAAPAQEPLGLEWYAALAGAYMLAGVIYGQVWWWSYQFADGPLRMLAAGVVGGALIGAVQMLGLRGRVPRAAPMVPAMAIGLGVIAGLSFTTRVTDAAIGLVVLLGCVVAQWLLTLRPAVKLLAWLAAGFAAPLAGFALGAGFLIITGFSSGSTTDTWRATIVIGFGLWFVLGALIARVLAGARPPA